MIGRFAPVQARNKVALVTCVAAAPPRMVMKSRRLMLSSIGNEPRAMNQKLITPFKIRVATQLWCCHQVEQRCLSWVTFDRFPVRARDVGYNPRSGHPHWRLGIRSKPDRMREPRAFRV